MTGKKKWIAIAGLFVVTFVLMFFYARQMRQNRMQKDIAKEILRLHVVANSDSKKDQALKMEVKEAVVTYLRGVMQDAESVDEARIQIQKRLPEIEAVAKEKMQQKGYSYDADATLSSCYFPVKTYGDMIFPAGEYEALKVNLGKSAGKNWWCVMYPPLCIPVAEDVAVQDEQAKAYFSDAEQDVLYHPERYRVKWKLAEWFKKWTTSEQTDHTTSHIADLRTFF